MTQTGEASVRSPLIPSGSVHLLKSFPVDRLKSDWMFAYGIDISDELKDIQQISLYRCTTSQLDFFMPLSAAGSDQIYQALQRFEWYHMADKWEFRQALRDVANCRKILEVGCGPGYFLETAARQLTGSVLKGIELDSAAVELARRKGLAVECVDLNELAARGEAFDAICSFQVLEHIARPYEFIQTMVRTLVPGGILILSVPNKDSYIKHEANLLDMPPHHMSRWNSFTFKYLENIFSLKLIRLSIEPLAQYHIPYYVRAYGQYWRKKRIFWQRVLTDSRLDRIANLLAKSGFYRYLRGHTLYGVFERL